MNMATTINNVLNIRDSVDDKSIFNSDSTDTSSEVDIIESCMNNLHIKRHFEVTLNHIGAGGFGVVYEARQKLDNRKYALKFVLIEQNFFEKREVEILASLDHANVLRYYTSWITDLPKPISNCKADEGGKEYDACLVIQTELCDPKKTLRTLMDSDRPGDKSDNLSLMDKRERHNIFLDIVSGLKYIHENGIMHRDLKPANIFIVKHNRAKIGDFGLARKYTMSDANGISPTSEKDRVCFSQDVGTYYYIAPEVKNSTVYDRKADFYSLGMILVELFHAWATEMGRYRTMNKLREQDFSDLKDISGNIQDVIQSLLSHEPSSRMELDMVINKVMKQLEPQESVEKDKVRAQPMNSPDMEYPRRPPRQISEASLGAPGENHQQIRATAGGLNLTKLTQQFKKTHVKKYIQREKDD